MNYSVLEQKILKTACYFDLFNFPLTNWEIFRNLYSAGDETLAAVDQALKNLIQIKALEYQEGFYFLLNRSQIITTLKDLYLLAQKKMKIALFYARMIKHLPFVQAIFVCNSLSYQNSKIESDIDFAIVAKAGRLWTCRFFCAGLMALLRRRPTSRTQKNRLCLSFFVSDANLNLESIAYEGDVHFIYWLKQFLPIYDRKNYTEDFFQANSWLNKYLPNIPTPQTNSRWQVKSGNQERTSLEISLLGKFGDWFEAFVKKIQLNIMPTKLKELAHVGKKDVVMTDTLLKFHDKDTRLEVRKNWEEKYQKIICSN